MSIPVYCATSKLSNFFQTSSSFLPNVTPHTAIAVQFSRDECYIDAVFWTSSWRRSSCHCRWEHTTTKVYIFVLFVEFFCWTRRSHYLLQIAANFLLVSLINECQTKVATYFTQIDCQGNDIVLLSSKIGGTFPPWNLKKAVAINFSGLFFFKIKPYKPWLLGKHGAIWFQREEACNDLDRSC